MSQLYTNPLHTQLHWREALPNAATAFSLQWNRGLMTFITLNAGHVSRSIQPLGKINIRNINVSQFSNLISNERLINSDLGTLSNCSHPSAGSHLRTWSYFEAEVIYQGNLFIWTINWKLLFYLWTSRGGGGGGARGAGAGDVRCLGFPFKGDSYKMSF